MTAATAMDTQQQLAAQFAGMAVNNNNNNSTLSAGSRLKNVSVYVVLSLLWVHSVTPCQNAPKTVVKIDTQEVEGSRSEGSRQYRV